MDFAVSLSYRVDCESSVGKAFSIGIQNAATEVSNDRTCIGRAWQALAQTVNTVASALISAACDVFSKVANFASSVLSLRPSLIWTSLKNDLLGTISTVFELVKVEALLAVYTVLGLLSPSVYTKLDAPRAEKAKAIAKAKAERHTKEQAEKNQLANRVEVLSRNVQRLERASAVVENKKAALEQNYEEQLRKVREELAESNEIAIEALQSLNALRGAGILAAERILFDLDTENMDPEDVQAAVNVAYAENIPDVSNEISQNELKALFVVVAGEDGLPYVLLSSEEEKPFYSLPRQEIFKEITFSHYKEGLLPLADRIHQADQVLMSVDLVVVEDADSNALEERISERSCALMWIKLDNFRENEDVEIAQLPAIRAFSKEVEQYNGSLNDLKEALPVYTIGEPAAGDQESEEGWDFSGIPARDGFGTGLEEGKEGGPSSSTASNSSSTSSDDGTTEANKSGFEERSPDELLK